MLISRNGQHREIQRSIAQEESTYKLLPVAHFVTVIIAYSNDVKIHKVRVDDSHSDEGSKGKLGWINRRRYVYWVSFIFSRMKKIF